MTLRPPGTCSAAATSSGAVIGRPCVDHHLRLSSRSHSPVTFLSRRTEPSTPSSLVTLAASAAGLVTGAASSQPTRAHVPHEM